MKFETLKAAAALPEIMLAALACLILVIGLFVKSPNNHRVTLWLSCLSLLATAWVTATDFSTQTTIAFNGLFVKDAMGDLMKIAMCVLTAGVFVYGRQYNTDRQIFKSEYYVLGLFGVVGMMVMSTTNHIC